VTGVKVVSEEGKCGREETNSHDCEKQEHEKREFTDGVKMSKAESSTNDHGSQVNAVKKEEEEQPAPAENEQENEEVAPSWGRPKRAAAQKARLRCAGGDDAKHVQVEENKESKVNSDGDTASPDKNGRSARLRAKRPAANDSDGSKAKKPARQTGKESRGGRGGAVAESEGESDDDDSADSGGDSDSSVDFGDAQVESDASVDGGDNEWGADGENSPPQKRGRRAVPVKKEKGAVSKRKSPGTVRTSAKATEPAKKKLGSATAGVRSLKPVGLSSGGKGSFSIVPVSAKMTATNGRPKARCGLSRSAASRLPGLHPR